MKIIQNFTLILLSLCIITFADTEYADPKPAIDNPRQIVFSITEDSPYAFDHILSVANNVLKFYGPEKVQMRVVAYSRGLKLLYKNNISTAPRVDALMQLDVEFVACGNTMRTYKVEEKDLVEGSEVVTAGVVELLERVKSGWIYIKP